MASAVEVHKFSDYVYSGGIESIRKGSMYADLILQETSSLEMASATEERSWNMSYLKVRPFLF